MSPEEDKPRMRYKDYKVLQAFGERQERIFRKPWKEQPKVVVSEEDRKIKAEIDRLELTIGRLKGIEVLKLRELTPREKIRISLIESRIAVLKGQLLAKKGVM